MIPYPFEQRAENEPFHLSNGQTLYSIRDLYEYLEHAEKAVFSHHVNTERNDFSVWIRDVFHQHQLATRTSFAHTRKAMRTTLADWISEAIHENHHSGTEEYPLSASLPPPALKRQSKPAGTPEKKEKLQKTPRKSSTSRKKPKKDEKTKEIDTSVPVINDSLHPEQIITRPLFEHIHYFVLGFITGVLFLLIFFVFPF